MATSAGVKCHVAARLLEPARAPAWLINHSSTMSATAVYHGGHDDVLVWSVSSPGSDAPLHAATCDDDVAAVQALLAMDPYAVFVRDEAGNLPIHIAAACPAPNIGILAQLLAAAPATVKAPNNDHDTPLHLAARVGSLRSVHALVQADPSAATERNAKGLTPLHDALVRCNCMASMCDDPAQASCAADVVAYLLRACTFDDPAASLRHAATSLRRHPLHIAASLGHTLLVGTILRLDPGAPTCRDDLDGSLPLHTAAGAGEVQAATELLAAAPLTAAAVNREGETPLHRVAMACAKPGADPARLMQIADLLLRTAPRAAEKKTRDGYTPLLIAAAHGSAQLVSRLLLHAPTLAGMRDINGTTPVRAAAWYNHPKVVKLLVTHAPRTASVQGRDGMNALRVAVSWGHADVVGAILGGVRSLAAQRSADGSTAMHTLMSSGLSDDKVAPVVAHLLRAAPSLANEHLDSRGTTPLHFAAAHGMLKTVAAIGGARKG